MTSDAGDSESIDVVGTLRFNEIEGGFWSLELDPEHPELGQHVVLSGYELPPHAQDGSHARMRVRARPDLVDFLMSGMRVDVLEAEVLDGGAV
jgi:hypothetical protein